MIDVLYDLMMMMLLLHYFASIMKMRMRMIMMVLIIIVVLLSYNIICCCTTTDAFILTTTTTTTTKRNHNKIRRMITSSSSSALSYYHNRHHQQQQKQIFDDDEQRRLLLSSSSSSSSSSLHNNNKNNQDSDDDDGNYNIDETLLSSSSSSLSLDDEEKEKEDDDDDDPAAATTEKEEEEEVDVTTTTTTTTTTTNNIKYQSRSTALSSSSAKNVYYEGSDERKQQLDLALKEIGIDPLCLTSSSSDYSGCTSAIRTYSSFILPKSKGALAMTKQPQRVTVIANQISFLLREYKSHKVSWIRNHDKSIEEIKKTNNNVNVNHPKIIIILDDIRSAHNVGNIIRAAEAGQCYEVMLCGSMTPSPPNPKVLKTAMGSTNYIKYKSYRSTKHAIDQLRNDNNHQNNSIIKIVGVETTSRSIPIWECNLFDINDDEIINNKNTATTTTTTNQAPADHDDDDDDEKEQDEDENKQQQQQQQQQQELKQPPPPIPIIAFIFGNELVGIDTTILDEECDMIISVPTYGIKNSLNVATCASIIIWEAIRQYTYTNINTTHDMIK